MFLIVEVEKIKDGYGEPGLLKGGVDVQRLYHIEKDVLSN